MDTNVLYIYIYMSCTMMKGGNIAPREGIEPTLLVILGLLG